jgi:hypothetical protein
MLPDSFEPDDAVACVSRPSTPDEVDDAGYLLANPDVLASGLSPQAHFAACGQAEGRLQAVNIGAVRAMRDWKLARLVFSREPGAARKPGKPLHFLSRALIAEFAIPEAPPVSAHPYAPSVVQLIHDHRDKLFLDVGAGLRDVYYPNVVNTEIYPSVSTDVLCVGEAMPFADEQFDFVFCFATLEHTKRPWDVAREICRVLKPGGTVMIDYPFMQPVHGYPHHYFNATPMGNRSLFEDACDIRSVEIGWHQHPIIGLRWMLTVFRNGLQDQEARRFEHLPVKALLDASVEELLAESFCRDLAPEMQRVIATGSMLEAVKRVPADGFAWRATTAGAETMPRAMTPDAAMIQLMTQNALLLGRLDAMAQSRSWRITRPLRFIGRLVRAVRSRTGSHQD